RPSRRPCTRRRKRSSRRCTTRRKPSRPSCRARCSRPRSWPSSAAREPASSVSTRPDAGRFSAVAEPRFQRVTSAAREHYDRAITVLDRLVPIALAINRGVLGYAVATAIAAVVLVSSVLIVEVPSSLWTWALLVLATAVLLLPAGVLVVF